LSFAHAFLDAGKRSVTLDLMTAAGRQLLAELAASCDAMIETPSAAAADHIDFELVRRRNPGLVLVDVSRTPPPPGTYRVHLIDVGTGLAILVQGHDFNLLYDGGTNDAAEKPLRVISYLAEAIGPSGDEACVPKHGRVPNSRLPLNTAITSATAPRNGKNIT
jgi:hypothetical protein